MDPLLVDLPAEIVGERVLIRPFRAGDGLAVFEAIDESAPADSALDALGAFSRRTGGFGVIRSKISGQV